MTTILRLVACAIAILAVVDPAIALRAAVRPFVTVVATDAASESTAELVRSRLSRDAGVETRGFSESPAAVVFVGSGPLPVLPERVPLSVVRPGGGSATQILAVHGPERIALGQTARFDVDVRASLEVHGVVRDGPSRLLRYTPSTSGVEVLRFVAHAPEGDSVVDVPLVVESRTYDVAVIEPRPSWAVASVRRALEQDPIFRVDAIARSARGVETRTGATWRLDIGGLDRFDAVIAGAPDELNATELAALDDFARRRGGAVLLLPDAKPKDGRLRLLPGSVQVVESLLETPATLPLGEGSLRASELIVVGEARTAGSIDVLAAAGERPVVVRWPLGDGQVVFSGALDAWRFQSSEQNRVWRGLVASIAGGAPRAIEVEAHPGIAAPGERVQVRVRLRAGVPNVPVSARIVGVDGAEAPLRLWPSYERGLYEGTFVAGRNRASIEVTAEGSGSASLPLDVEQGIHHPPDSGPRTLEFLARSRGGVVVDAEQMDPLIAHIRSLPHATARQPSRPMRSPWWAGLFALTLSAEWYARRRQGQR